MEKEIIYNEEPAVLIGASYRDSILVDTSKIKDKYLRFDNGQFCNKSEFVFQKSNLPEYLYKFKSVTIGYMDPDTEETIGTDYRKKLQEKYHVNSWGEGLTQIDGEPISEIDQLKNELGYKQECQDLDSKYSKPIYKDTETRYQIIVKVKSTVDVELPNKYMSIIDNYFSDRVIESGSIWVSWAKYSNALHFIAEQCTEFGLKCEYDNSIRFCKVNGNYAFSDKFDNECKGGRIPSQLNRGTVQLPYEKAIEECNALKERIHDILLQELARKCKTKIDPSQFSYVFDMIHKIKTQLGRVEIKQRSESELRVVKGTLNSFENTINSLLKEKTNG